MDIPPKDNQPVPPAFCPGCKQTEAALKCLGPIPASDTFAGRALGEPISGGFLYSCNECSLRFRHPSFQLKELNRLYKAGNVQHWSQGCEQRTDWAIARDWIHCHCSRDISILDIGCFTGGFLGSLEEFAGKYGVEIHRGARNVAQENGVTFIAEDWSELDDMDKKFDVITAFDVIEHTPAPYDFMQTISSSLKPGGLLIISTGNSRCLPALLEGARHYYYVNPEHLSFVSPHWFQSIKTYAGLEIRRLDFFSHGRKVKGGTYQLILQTILNLAFITMPGFFGYLRRCGWGGKNAREHSELSYYPPVWSACKDHFIVLLQDDL